jgi:hypothetical protein
MNYLTNTPRYAAVNGGYLTAEQDPLQYLQAFGLTYSGDPAALTPSAARGLVLELNNVIGRSVNGTSKTFASGVAFRDPQGPSHANSYRATYAPTVAQGGMRDPLAAPGSAPVLPGTPSPASSQPTINLALSPQQVAAQNRERVQKVAPGSGFGRTARYSPYGAGMKSQG